MRRSCVFANLVRMSSILEPLPGFALARLRAFDGVAVTGSMGAAAAMLFLTQPAVSRAVQALEQEIGVRLLSRGRTGSFLTPAGRMFARRVRRFFHQMEDALAEASGLDAASVERLCRKIADVHLRAILAIAHASSFRQAARAIGVAEPTLHRPARELERLVRAPLFRRGQDGVGLSARGAELARRLSLSLTELSAGREEIAGDEARISVGVLPLAPKSLLVRAAGRLRERHPRFRLIVREAGYDELATGSRRGTIDVIFGALRAPPPFEDLVEERLFVDPYCVVCRRDHPLTALATLQANDLRPYEWVYPTPDMPRRIVLDRLLEEVDLPNQVGIETDSIGMLAGLLSSSDRLSLLPQSFATLDSSSEGLAMIAFDVRHASRHVGLTTRMDWLPTLFQSEFVSELRSLCASPQPARP